MNMPTARMEPEHVVRLMQILELTDEQEFSCDEVFDVLDQYVETEMRGEEATQVMSIIKRHLEMCRDCKEEYQALLRALQSFTAN